ncbi:hypothetical protein [Caulobacter rhizosphaerae]|uniref:hypothetical protein n=1 Tax=Caulobacter rhizosphaerae TaxID=2010972 RepID=UPI0013D77910|nr:hypothetical protein [Caulobacter rhizosphaerae]
MIIICMAALLRGGWEEKVLGAAYMAACMASLAVEERPWVGPQGLVIAIDAIVLALAVGVVLRSSKGWPIVAAAFQVLTVGAHLAFVAAHGRLGAAGYLTVLALWSYGTVAAIAWGAVPLVLASSPMFRHDRVAPASVPAPGGQGEGPPPEDHE